MFCHFFSCLCKVQGLQSLLLLRGHNANVRWKWFRAVECVKKKRSWLSIINVPNPRKSDVQACRKLSKVSFSWAALAATARAVPSKPFSLLTFVSVFQHHSPSADARRKINAHIWIQLQQIPEKKSSEDKQKKNGSRFADGQQLLCFVMAYSMLRLCTQRMYLSTWVKVGLGETTPINSRNLESRGQATKLMAARQRHLGPGTIG